MLHTHRRFGVTEIVSTDALAELITEHTWTTCSAFRLGDLVFANDSTSADGAQEYAVVRNGRQIESITFGWCDRATALGYIEALVAGMLGDDYGAFTNTLEPVDQHRPCSGCR
jgi:hypothetical protein